MTTRLNVWKAEVFDGADAISGTKALSAAGFLVRGEGSKLAIKERVPAWANGAGLRFYCVKAAIMGDADDVTQDVSS